MRVFASCARACIFARIFMKIWLVVKYYLMNISFKFHKDPSFHWRDMAKIWSAGVFAPPPWLVSSGPPLDRVKVCFNGYFLGVQKRFSRVSPELFRRVSILFHVIQRHGQRVFQWYIIQGVRRIIANLGSILDSQLIWQVPACKMEPRSGIIFCKNRPDPTDPTDRPASLVKRLAYAFNVVRCPHPNCSSHQQSMCGVPPLPTPIVHPINKVCVVSHSSSKALFSAVVGTSEQIFLDGVPPP